MFDANAYTEELLEALKAAFGSRLVYLGLQGSYQRGEADEGSDIDMIVVLDELTIGDMDTYRRIIDRMERPELSCGFICGRAELAHWNACEIWQLVHDTADRYGRLAELVPRYTEEDIRMQVRISLGNLYHELCHRYIHASRVHNVEGLRGSYKSVFYILQNLHHLRTGRCAKSKAALLEELDGADAAVLDMALRLKSMREYDFDAVYSLLFTWCQETLRSEI